MKLCYVDETGNNSESPVLIMVGVIVDAQRLGRTTEQFADLLERSKSLTGRGLSEWKSSQLYRGKGAWSDVPGDLRAEFIGELCAWLDHRRHSLALAAIDRAKLAAASPPPAKIADEWLAAGFHIALQLQRQHQKIEKGKGQTILVFDENKRTADALSDVLFDPPTWSDAYYGRSRSQAALDQIIDSAYYAKSHHVGLIQLADLYAFIFRRFCELAADEPEAYSGEWDRIRGWVGSLVPRLLDRPERWPKRSRDQCSDWYCQVAPEALLANT